VVYSHTPVPAAVEGLTVNVSDGEIHMRWNISVGVVSHYAVIVVVDGHTMQWNVSEEELKLQIDELHVSGYHTLEVEVMAVNDAGSGPSATATFEYAADDGVTDNDMMDDEVMGWLMSVSQVYMGPQVSMQAGQLEQEEDGQFVKCIFAYKTHLI